MKKRSRKSIQKSDKQSSSDEIARKLRREEIKQEIINYLLSKKAQA